MKVREALIAWTPGTDKIAVGRLIQKDGKDWTAGYEFTGGAVYTEVRSLTGDKAALRVFVDFHTVVVRDGVNVQAAHKAFLAIDEYRALIAPDIEGAS